ncbi:MAG: DUF1800 domain-containing protein [Sphingomonadales bacterium]|nr:DUF1800 domain-containing protein [Sphingomonadales bacterium]MBD3773977.1 DUF1800 domain-containing protein [Paracoccaceae bacterium]
MQDAAIAWSRFGSGARPQDRPPADPRRWLLGQMDRFAPRPAALAQTDTTDQAIVQYKILDDVQRERRKTMPGKNSEAFQTEREKDLNRQGREFYVTSVHARMAAAVESETPFIERLVHFWANHFAISYGRLQTMRFAPVHEFNAIRPHVLGNFRDLLVAASLHPAMQMFLDQAQSIGPNSPFTRRRENRGQPGAGLNENLAREIMELHTLGVRSGYSQQDVTEFARALTGWTVDGFRRMRTLQPMGEGRGYVPELHEPGTRRVMGKAYPDTGPKQALAILDDLAAHPATAKHVATKLAQHFAGDDPPAAMIGRLEMAFASTGGDLPSVYRALVASPEAWVAGPVKFLQPWEWAVASFRALGAPLPAPAVVNGLLDQLGQPTWKPGSPAGWTDKAEAWAAPDALMRRVEAGERIARSAQVEDVPALAEKLFPGGLGAATLAQLRRAESVTQSTALLLASPEMMRR